MKWINIKSQFPKDTIDPPTQKIIGVPVLVKLNDTKKRKYGDVVISIYYKGKFHKDFKNGYIQDVTYWMPLPKSPKN